LCQISEEIIGNALNFFRGLLEDPNIWQEDLIVQEAESNDLDTFLRGTLFTDTQLYEMLKTIL
jgi:hypothetical protein